MILIDIFDSFGNKAELKKEKHSTGPHLKNDLSSLFLPVSMFVAGQRPLVVVVIITGAQEEVRRSSLKRRKSEETDI